MPIESAIGIFTGANSTSRGVPGLVPATDEAGQTNLFLRSDGVWSEIVTASSAKILQTIIASGETHDEAIDRIVKNSNIKPQTGDIVILQELIYGSNNYQRIAYIYNIDKWIALDGNYNAEKVYLSEDLTITADVGVQKLNGAGSKTLNTAGKNLKEILNLLLVERKLPTYTPPAATIVCEQAGEYEVGTVITPSYTATFNPGSYSYDPKNYTGVEINSWTATFNSKTLNSNEGSFESIVLTDDFEKNITVSINHTAGIAPKDNLGNDIVNEDELQVCQIPSGTKTANSKSIKSYRNIFYGSKLEPINIESENIRQLTYQKVPSKNEEFDIEITEGAKQVIIAIPKERELLKVADEVAFGTDILSKFKITTVEVDGATQGYKKEYNVYTYTPAAALGKNTYAVIMG